MRKQKFLAAFLVLAASVASATPSAQNLMIFQSDGSTKRTDSSTIQPLFQAVGVGSAVLTDDGLGNLVVSSGSVSQTLANGKILVGNGSNQATAVTPSGDVTITNAGVTTVNSAGGATSTELGYVHGVTSAIQTQLNGKQATGNYVTALTGDVTATGPGSVAATVNTVGGSTAANVHTAELAANAATSANTASTIVARDSGGAFSMGVLTATSLVDTYTNTATSGTIAGLQINATYNQLSGTAANTDLLISRTETVLGSGAQNLIDAQVASASKFKVSDAGAMTVAGATTLSNLGLGVVHASSAGLLSSTSVSLTADVSGVLPTANGGTGVNGTATFPSSGTVLTDTNTISPVTNKTISALSNTLSNLIAEYDLACDGSTTTFTLAGQNLLATNHVLLYVDGRLQRSGSSNAYTTATGTTNQIVFTVAPSASSWCHAVVVNQ